ncbi:MAG: histidine ammonia-lyase [Planctomycetota bacterium]
MDPHPISSDARLDATLVEQVARSGTPLALDDAARERVARCRDLLDAALDDGLPHYGINTGFGSLARERIAPDDLEELQRNLVRSHAAGTGAPLPTDVVRATMTVLAFSLARARSGVRPEVIDRICLLLDRGVTPVVPESGSVGASGDLAPLAHIAQVLMGEGEAHSRRERLPGGEALRRAGVEPITLGPKEGLALLNGTHLMAGRFALIACDLRRVVRPALLACAMSIDAARASHGFLDPRVYEARNQPGPAEIAGDLRSMLQGSTIAESHRENDPRVQDPYSFRAAPLVIGAAHDTVMPCLARLDDELNAVTDNPLIFEANDGSPDIISAGCFHGMPIALPLDTLTIALTHIAGIAERRMYHILSAFDPESRQRAFMSPKPGVMSGFMVVQYAAAAMCNELIGVCTPASVANLSTCAGMEDYNSFGPRAAAKAARAVELLRSVVACELLTAAEGVEAHRPHRSGDRVERALSIIRGAVEPLSRDRSPSPDVESIERLITRGAFADV